MVMVVVTGEPDAVPRRIVCGRITNKAMAYIVTKEMTRKGMTLTSTIVLRVMRLAFFEVMPIHRPTQASAARLANVESVEAAEVARAARLLHGCGMPPPQVVR